MFSSDCSRLVLASRLCPPPLRTQLRLGTQDLLRQAAGPAPGSGCRERRPGPP
jgi:hypothetical protein